MNISNIFYTPKIDQLAKVIAKEIANRNYIIVCDYPQSISANKSSYLGDILIKNCTELHELLLKIVLRNFEQLKNTKEKPDWLNYALEFGGTKGKKYDPVNVAIGIGVILVEKQRVQLDKYVKCLNDAKLINELGLHITDASNLLISLSDRRIELRNHGIVFNDKVLIYPHQFLRRYYSANFVGIPFLLNEAKKMGAEVSIRIDPLRKSSPVYYREYKEFDFWGGLPYSKELLLNKFKSAPTLFGSRGLYNFHYQVDYTIFRTQMMDKDQREFMIEEYCPLDLPFWSEMQKSPGVGEKYFIQKFAHIIYDQNKSYFNHLDGAVRVFKVNEYIKYFDNVKLDIKSGEKIGKRHKLFLVDGTLSEKLVQELLSEWFRYNPHIIEYFTGSTVEPSITYEQLDAFKHKRKYTHK